MEKIGKFSLHNGGGFVARIKILFVNEQGELQSSKESGDILADDKRHYYDPNDYGIADGSVVRLYIVVQGGTDCRPVTPFIYERGNVITANYHTSGPVFSNHHKLQSVA